MRQLAAMRNPRRSWMFRVAVGLAAVGLAGSGLGVAGCGSGSETKQPQRSATMAPAVVLDPPLTHVHGLHIGAGGTVLAGTHSGLFAVDPRTGAVTRVGESDDDFMGLTGVPATDALFSSGHPGRSNSAPNPLGLRASTDGGRTWVSRSLSGEVDFHALAATDRVLVGFGGSTGLRVSADGAATWSAGAPLQAASLAITNSGVWAVTAAGLQFSSDTARSFDAVSGAPALVMIAGAGDTLWGVDTAGDAWQSRDGRDWRNAGSIGRVEALGTDGINAYAATAKTLYRLAP